MLLASPGTALAQNAPAGEITESVPYAAPIAEAAQRFGVPERWIWAVMRAESNGDLRAVSPVGAMGLMQIMPATWASLRARYRLGSDPFDARDNILAGAAYLREMYDRYGNATAMLAAYNAGSGRTDEYLSRGRPLPVATRAYIAKLASITGGSDDTRLAVALPPDPFAWRRAGLFPTHAGGSSIAATVPSEGTVAVPSAAAAEPVAFRQASLFVPLSDEITR